MVCLKTVISDIITEIEIENTFNFNRQITNHNFVIDLNYLRHHPKLQNARIFRLILGFEKGLWKKPEYDKKNTEKYSMIIGLQKRTG